MQYGASYILPDGKFLILKDIGFRTHTEYEKHLEKEGLIQKPDPYSRVITNLNQWIRINDGSKCWLEVLAELPIKGITEEQYKSLFIFIDYLRSCGKNFIEIGCEEHSVGVFFTNKSLWYNRFNLKTFNNQEIEYFIRDAYRIYLNDKGEIDNV